MELSSGIFWCSVVEMFMFLLTFSLFLTTPGTMAPIFLHILHIPRGVVGGLIVWKMPNSQDLILEAAADSTNQKVTHEMFGAFILSSAQKSLKKVSDTLSKLLLAYFILTCISFMFDIVDFFIGVSYLQNGVTEYSYGATCILILSSIFVTLDLYYIIWAVSFKIKLPSSLSGVVIQALIGIFKNLNAIFEEPE